MCVFVYAVVPRKTLARELEKQIKIKQKGKRLYVLYMCSCTYMMENKKSTSSLLMQVYFENKQFFVVVYMYLICMLGNAIEQL